MIPVKLKMTLTALASAALVAAGTPTASAQSIPAGRVLNTLFQSDIRLQAPATTGVISHEAHFLLDDLGAELNVFNQQVLVQLATLPIGSTSGGFSYAFDAAAGTFERVTESFGPLFADRAFTNGRKRLTFGSHLLYSKMSTYEGSNLDSGDIKFYLRHSAVNGAFFEGDLMQADLRLDISSTQMVFFANYGVSDKLDVSVAVPVTRVQMDASVDATVIPLSTAGLPIHRFPGGATSATFTRGASASGLGDLQVRGKYRFVSFEGGGLAAAVNLRMPTGSAEDLLGTGTVTGTFALIGSSEYGRFSPHFNLEYSVSGEGELVEIPNEFGYRLGADFIASPRLTLSGDLLGRSLIDAGRLKVGQTQFRYRDSADRPLTTTINEYAVREGALNLVTLAFGGKVNIAGNLLFNANLLIPVTSSGMSAKVTPVIGFDYLF